MSGGNGDRVGWSIGKTGVKKVKKRKAEGVGDGSRRLYSPDRSLS